MTDEVLRDVRRHPHRAQLIDEVCSVIALVRSQRDRPWPVGTGLYHVQCRYALAMPIGCRQAGIDQQAMTVLHEPMPHKAELGLLFSGCQAALAQWANAISQTSQG